MSDLVLLSHDDQSRRDRLEAVVDAGLQTFIEVGNALLELRDGRLYRATHDTFDAYLQDRFGFSRSYASRLMNAARTAEAVLPMGNITSERQARALTGLPPEEQRATFERAKAQTGKAQPTAKDLAAARPQPPRPHGDGTATDITTPAAVVAARAVAEVPARHVEPVSSEPDEDDEEPLTQEECEALVGHDEPEDDEPAAPHPGVIKFVEGSQSLHDSRYVLAAIAALHKASDLQVFDAERLGPLLDDTQIEMFDRYVTSVARFVERIHRARRGLRVVQS